MKQIYYTFCCAGKSVVRGAGGDRPRAISKGISGTEAEQIKKLCFYSISIQPFLEKKMSREAILQNAPVSLKLCNSPVGRVVVHICDALPDQETSREGNYFAHVLTSLPEKWTAYDVLSLWGSPSWVIKDENDFPEILPELEDSSFQKGIINDQSFVDFLNRDPENIDIFRFLLKAWFSKTPDQKIVFVCEPERSAFALWGLTRCFPQKYWNSLTFSTYESPSVTISQEVVAFAGTGDYSDQDELVFKTLRQRQDFRFYWRKDGGSSEEEPRAQYPFWDELICRFCEGKLNFFFDFLKTVPDRYEQSVEWLQFFWIFRFHQTNLNLKQLRTACTVPEINKVAATALTQSGRFSLSEQLTCFDVLRNEERDLLLNRILHEHTIAQLRNMPDFQRLIIQGFETPAPPEESTKEPAAAESSTAAHKENAAYASAPMEQKSKGCLLALFFLPFLIFNALR
ncbi:MAG: hypothetical protein Q4D38_06245 [Planctomycetia bacterium]|nr:hypothetical protein [Planctomycetia bacterium]